MTEQKIYDENGAERIKLTPSPNGENCVGNGTHKGIEICCDECDFFLECFIDFRKVDCE